MTRYIAGIDVGGTVTVFTTYDQASGTMTAWKNPSTPDGNLRIAARDAT